MEKSEEWLARLNEIGNALRNQLCATENGIIKTIASADGALQDAETKTTKFADIVRIDVSIKISVNLNGS